MPRSKRDPDPDRLDPENDLLRGGQAIADFTGLTLPMVYRHCELGHIPHKRVGAQLIASKRKLRVLFGLE